MVFSVRFMGEHSSCYIVKIAFEEKQSGQDCGEIILFILYMNNASNRMISVYPQKINESTNFHNVHHVFICCFFALWEL